MTTTTPGKETAMAESKPTYAMDRMAACVLTTLADRISAEQVQA